MNNITNSLTLSDLAIKYIPTLLDNLVKARMHKILNACQEIVKKNSQKKLPSNIIQPIQQIINALNNLLDKENVYKGRQVLDKLECEFNQIIAILHKKKINLQATIASIQEESKQYNALINNYEQLMIDISKH